METLMSERLFCIKQLLTEQFQVTDDWAAQTETSDWAAASGAEAAASQQPNWGGSSQW